MARREVLIVSADPLTREVLHDLLVAEAYGCLLAADGREGIEMFRGWRPPLVVTDMDLPIMDGMELTRAVREEDQEAAVIVLHGPVATEVGNVPGGYARTVRSVLLKLGAYMVLEKPLDMQRLLFATEGALYSRQIARSQRGLLHQRWTRIEPLSAVAELLAMYGAVFSLPTRRLAPCPSRHHESRGLPTTCAPALTGSIQSGARFTAVCERTGSCVSCGWCGLANRPGVTTCWSCGLAPNTKSRRAPLLTR